jgi:small subunit ribosomal protein S23
MGRYNFTASRVYQTATQVLEANFNNPRSKVLHAPPWYKIVGAITPGEILTRPQPVQLREKPRKLRTKKPSKLFKPQPIIYEEDKLRNEFYSDHPWELARPRVILEEDGKDAQRCDWSKIEQPSRQLDGERYGLLLLCFIRLC